MVLDKLFQLMAEKQASDIFISVGVPIHIKIQGVTAPVNQQVMDPAMVEKIAFELMTPEQLKTFETTMEMNLSFGVPRVGNFRINIFTRIEISRLNRRRSRRLTRISGLDQRVIVHGQRGQTFPYTEFLIIAKPLISSAIPASSDIEGL